MVAPLGAGAALVAVALVGVPGSFTGGGTRSWWRRNENMRADAQAAKDAAAQAFYELDSAQRDVRISVETVKAVDDSPGARRAVGEFDELSRRVDEVSGAYIAALDAHDLDADGLEAGAAARARRDLEQSRQQLQRMKAELEKFHGTLEPLLSRAESQLAQVAPAVERARQALLGATAALDAVRAAGLRADELAARLAALGPELTRLNEGAGRHGVPETLQRADDVLRRAEAVRGEAAHLPERAREIDRRVVSLRTRMQALETRAGTVDPTLSELRRRFSSECWQDLQRVPQQTAESVRTARTKLEEAAAARDEQRWADATAALGTARALLNTSDGAVAAVGERLRQLTEVERDPKAEIERTRFAVRDAQRLAMAGRNAPDPRHAGPLDAAVGRLDRAVEGLTGRHPDYWHFLRETAAVRETAAQVVQQIRESMGSGH
ncbi:hypothetical protein C7M71_008200 [Peterkaempfera bronchialis]|uniref:Uncharacterized protein n=1 Tax=Peterkaempfera bronchialis TaxID=2126346 RepID=A0A345T5M0_9ACTN|nr:hypothetical protein [Peterkaempfera bronchialis]AXI81275.1 hypothetical protein C7M71_008200 [Peterkaempfera bronchialis]